MAVKVSFCAWCRDPNKPDWKHHPNGQLEHIAPNPLYADFMTECEREADEVMRLLDRKIFAPKSKVPEAQNEIKAALRIAVLDAVRANKRLEYAEAGIV
jgi:hypothetical protein